MKPGASRAGRADCPAQTIRETPSMVAIYRAIVAVLLLSLVSTARTYDAAGAATAPMLLTCQPSVRGSQPFFSATEPACGPVLTPHACATTTWCSNDSPYCRTSPTAAC